MHNTSSGGYGTGMRDITGKGERAFQGELSDGMEEGNLSCWGWCAGFMTGSCRRAGGGAEGRKLMGKFQH